MTNKILFSIGFCLISLLFAYKQKARETLTTMVYANETDFICGMKVQPEYTDTCHYDGKVYAFCSASCKEEFQVNHVSFLNKETGH